MGIAVLGVFLGSATLSILHGQEATVRGGDRVHAVYLAQRALEGVRSIRDANFGALTVGQHGVEVGPGGVWVLSGSGMVSSGGYLTVVTVESVSSGLVRVTARTSWTKYYGLQRSVILSTDLTDWRSPLPVGNWGLPAVEGSFVSTGTPLLNDVVVAGNYAFVSSEISDGGVGLYVFDISNLTTPIRVATSFLLGAPGYGLVVRGTTLYIAVGNSSQEIRAYDISSPSTLSSGNLIASYDIPGNSLARSMFSWGGTLYVGAVEAGGSRHELYSFDVTAGGLTFLDSLDDQGTVSAIAVSGTAAYLASSLNTSELRVVDIEDPRNLRNTSLQGYNVTGSQDGVAIASAGTGILLGRANGSAIEELVLFDRESGIPTPPPGPWYHEIGERVGDVDMDPLRCYGFLGTYNDAKELQIVHAKSQALPELAYYDTDTGDGRGLFYDAVRDRLFLVTNTALLIFKPDPPSGSCP